MIADFISPEILGVFLIAVMLFSIFVGFPISFTLIFLGFVFGYLGFGKLVFYLMTLQFSMVMTEQTLAAVPLFVFMGIMMEQAGLMERLFSWESAVNSIIDAPILGYGPGTSYQLYFDFRNPNFRLFTGESSFRHAHSEILELLQEDSMDHLQLVVGQGLLKDIKR